jgi:chemotaxis protein methyltransferase CheR
MSNSAEWFGSTACLSLFGTGAMAFTFFFRDAQTLELLVEEALPTLCGQAFIRIWDAGCAHGPECYTLAMLLREKMSDYVFHNVRIHATDVDRQFGPQITSGIYAQQEVQRIPPPIRERYFRPAMDPGRVQVTEEIRAKVSFSEHDLLSLTPPREDFSLIICKNVLLHFDEAQRLDVFRMFHRALRPGGLLATEHTQKIPAAVVPLFQQAVSNAQIYRKIEIPSALERDPSSGATRRVDLPGGRPVSPCGCNSQVLSGG